MPDSVDPAFDDLRDRRATLIGRIEMLSDATKMLNRFAEELASNLSDRSNTTPLDIAKAQQQALLAFSVWMMDELNEQVDELKLVSREIDVNSAPANCSAA